MKRIVFVFCALVSSLVSNYAQEAKQPATADGIIQRYIEKSGVMSDSGVKEVKKYTLTAVQTTVLEKKDETIVQYVLRAFDADEKKLFIKADSEEKKNRSALAINKEEGWHCEWPLVSKVLKYKENELTKIWMQNFALVQLPRELTDTYSFQRTLGEEKEFDGKRCTCVIVTPKASNAASSTFYFDKETGMLVHSDNENLSCDFKDYQTFGALTINATQIITYSEKLRNVTKVKSITTKIQDIKPETVDETLFCKEAVQNAFKNK